MAALSGQVVGLVGSLLLLGLDTTAGTMDLTMLRDRSFIQLGASIELVCTWGENEDYMNDNMEVVWSFNNKDIISGASQRSKYHEKEKEQESVLRINNIQRPDQGNYTCHVGNADHWASETFELDLNLPPEISISPQNTAYVGRDTTLICKMIGQPKAEITWGFISDKGQMTSANYMNMFNAYATPESIQNSTGRYLLVHLQPRYSQMGQYFCQSRGKSVSSKLVVRGIFVKCLPSLMKASLYDDVTFNCLIESLPRLNSSEITWKVKPPWMDMYEIESDDTKFQMNFLPGDNDWTITTTLFVRYLLPIDNNMIVQLYAAKMVPLQGTWTDSKEMRIAIASECTGCYAVPLMCHDNVCMCPGYVRRNENSGSICELGDGGGGRNPDDFKGTNDTFNGNKQEDKKQPKVVIVNHTSVAIIVGVTMGALALILVVIILYICYRKRRKAKKNASRFDPNYIYQYEYHGEANNLNYNPTFMNPGYYMPVPRQNLKKENTYVSTLGREQLEFPREKLQLGVDLGEGRFGKVIQARAMNINGSGNWIQVAVKTCRGTATDSEKQDLYQELELMRKIPNHPNIVSLLGCCSKNDPLYIIMEYVHRGSLLSYLRKCRPMSQMSRGSRDSTMSDATLTSSFMQPRAKDLTIFALQIARGMAHVNTCGIIHRDLASRNILLANDFTCKICDFGLARDVEGVDVYERTSKGPLPIRWMAPEALEENMYTKKSDIWSYGVLLWEIVTLGATPYQGKSANEVMRQVLSGFYLPQPLHCREEMYDLMVKCWEKADSRPSFVEIVSHFEALMDDDYIILSEYDESDYQWLDSYTMEERV